jgi:hypothetical protein
MLRKQITMPSELKAREFEQLAQSVEEMYADDEIEAGALPVIALHLRRAVVILRGAK